MTNHFPYHIKFGYQAMRPAFPNPEEFFKFKTPNPYVEYMSQARNVVQNETREC